MTTEQTTKLEQLARNVLSHRRYKAELKDKLDVLQEAIRLANHETYEEYHAIAEDLTQAETELCTAALEVYADTGDKHPGPGVDIRVTQKVEYATSDALIWAEKHGLCLTLNKPAFERLAKSGQVEGNIAALHWEPSATIAQDLEKALKES